jgi:5-methyltetrahydrofolate--homocysteine methyltransferase
MPRSIQTPDQFIIIGENIHTTRVIKRTGRRVTTLEDGSEAITFRGSEGQTGHMTVPEVFKDTQPYEDGQLKHFMIAVWKGLHGNPGEQEEGAAYVHFESKRQIDAGASYLDLNVDEYSTEVEEQKAAMRWLVTAALQVATVPPAIDSSNTEVIAEGLSTYDGSRGKPMINSLALERMEVLDLVEEHKTRVVVSAASARAMPRDAEERTQNTREVLRQAVEAGVLLEDIFVDPLVFPVSVDPSNGRKFLDAVAAIRQEYGPSVHITGGLSNVAYGLPNRRLLNDTFCYMALEEGLDSGIINPLETRPKRVFEIDIESEPVKLAMAVFNGEDEFCMEYLSAYRAGKLG